MTMTIIESIAIGAAIYLAIGAAIAIGAYAVADALSVDFGERHYTGWRAVALVAALWPGIVQVNIRRGPRP